MTITEPSRPPHVGEQASDDELRDALIREARQRARRRRCSYVGVVIAVAAIAAWSTASSGNPPPPATLDDLLPPAQAGPRTAAPAPPTTTPASVPTQFKASSFLVEFKRSGSLLDVGALQRSPLPAGLAEGFTGGLTYVTGYVPSPDGTRVVAVNHCHLWNLPCVGDGRMAIGNIDGSDVRTITPPAGTRLTADSARWSPDGTKIVYAATDGAGSLGEVFIEDVTTGAQSQVTHLDLAYYGASFLSPTFTPDGQTVLFALPSDSGFAPGVWSVPVTGGEPTLVPTLVGAASPAPLPDGKTVAYVCGMPQICVRSIDDPGPGSFRVLTPAVSTGISLVWDLEVSPDGTRLVVRGMGVIDVGTGALEYALLDGASAAWLDNDTLIVTEVTRG